MECKAVIHQMSWLTTNEAELHFRMKTPFVASSYTTIHQSMSYILAVQADERPHLDTSVRVVTIPVTNSAMDEVQ